MFYGFGYLNNVFMTNNLYMPLMPLNFLMPDLFKLPLFNFNAKLNNTVNVKSAKQSKPAAKTTTTANKTQTTVKSGSTKPVSNSKYSAIINKYAKKYGVDPNLILCIINQESNGNANARSGKGAGGLMQLMPATAKALGVKNVYDPEQNIAGGTKYISQLLKQFNGNVKLALAAYNAGPGNVKKYGNTVPPFKETQNYVANICRNYEKSTSAGLSVLA